MKKISTLVDYQNLCVANITRKAYESIPLIIDDPHIMFKLSFKPYYLDFLGKSDFPIPLTATPMSGRNIRVSAKGKSETLNFNDVYAAFEDNVGEKGKIVSKPDGGALGMGVEFYELTPENLRTALRRENNTCRMVQAFVEPPKDFEYMEEYKSIVVGGSSVGSYALRAPLKFSDNGFMTNMRRGGIPQKMEDRKKSDELAVLSESVVKSLGPGLNFARIDTLPDKDGNLVILEANGYGQFCWEGFNRIHKKDPVENLADMVKEKNGGDVSFLYKEMSVIPHNYPFFAAELKKRGIDSKLLPFSKFCKKPLGTSHFVQDASKERIFYHF